jgi:hypothetical protein
LNCFCSQTRGYFCCPFYILISSKGCITNDTSCLRYFGIWGDSLKGIDSWLWSVL